MKIILQRVLSAKALNKHDGKLLGEISNGYCLLIGISVYLINCL